MRLLAALIIAPLIVQSAEARSSSSQITELKRICVSLLGHQAGSQPWHQLRPYLRDSHALDASEAYCGMTCTGSVALRGAHQLEYMYVNPQHLGWWKADEAIVYSVTLTRGKKQLFHRELAPKKT
jgi:hypothetical protein